MIAATLHGPDYWAPNHDETTIEVFNTLEDVIEALFQRYSANGAYDLHYTTLDGKEHDVRFPTFGAGCALTCYLTDGDHPDRIYTEEGALEVLSAVHGGYWDYIVALDWAREDENQLIVTVLKSGV